MTDVGYELGWDSPIEHDGESFILLQEQDCDFEVLEFERGRHSGSEKVPACSKAALSIKLTGKEGSTTVTENLLLYSTCEWKLCEFFKAIGQRKHGEKIAMNWNKVVRSRGRCHVYIDKWIDKDGKERQNNKIKYFIDPAEPVKTFKTGEF